MYGGYFGCSLVASSGSLYKIVDKTVRTLLEYGLEVEMPIEIAKRDIKLYKTFRGTNAKSVAPFQRSSWGALRKGRVLVANAFDLADGICILGVHASRLLNDACRIACLDARVVWVVVIPKGTKYYKSTIDESKRKLDMWSEGEQYRAEKVKLVRQVK